ncbi:hypothetical protein AUR64_08000 [Haloprofundus marisrubri]|uniref:Acetyltransferase n=1 Tax=Haloprofundus marisrubri TaxID=1514971 RepID=A0A0W1RDA2_9EURY|nr:hypothetical protein [Haloprofundus marisrubri]KTG10601.1 hypothetical protein AUR64_08000 [Haloprofundus marisrubri]
MSIAVRRDREQSRKCIEITELAAEDVPACIDRQRERGVELYLERRGTRTFLVSAPAEKR